MWGLIHGVGPRQSLHRLTRLGPRAQTQEPKALALARERPSRAYSCPCLSGPLGFNRSLPFLLSLRPGARSPHGYQAPTLSQPGQSSHPISPTGLSRQTGPAPPSLLGNLGNWTPSLIPDSSSVNGDRNRTQGCPGVWVEYCLRSTQSRVHTHKMGAQSSEGWVWRPQFTVEETGFWREGSRKDQLCDLSIFLGPSALSS